MQPITALQLLLELLPVRKFLPGRPAEWAGGIRLYLSSLCMLSMHTCCKMCNRNCYPHNILSMLVFSEFLLHTLSQEASIHKQVSGKTTLTPQKQGQHTHTQSK